MPSSYQIERADAFAWLGTQSANSFEAVVSDPPFAVLEYLPSELAKRRAKKGGIWRLPQVFDGFERKPTPRFTVLSQSDLARLAQFHTRLAVLMERVLVPGAHVFLASQSLLSHIVASAFSGAGFEVRGQIVRVVKTLRGGDRPKGAHLQFANVSVAPRACYEPWLIFRKPFFGTIEANLRKWGTGALRRPSRDVPFSDLIVAPPPSQRERAIAPHPSLKPQGLMRRLTYSALPLGKGRILDPFMGSGSTIAAATAQELLSVGVETDWRYFRMAEAAIPKLASLIESRNGSPAPVAAKKSA